MYEHYSFASDHLDAFEMADDLEDLGLPDEDEDEDEVFDEALDMFEETLDLGEALRGALSEEYADSTPEELDSAVSNVMDVLTPAESLSFANALRQIEAGAGKAIRDPTFAQIARTALPLAGGAVGSLGGPVGTAVGGTLGGAAAKAFASGPAARPTAAAGPGPKPPVAGTELPAAAKGLVLMNNPAVQQAALAAALGQQGRPTVGGLPVGAVMQMLSTIFGEAAAEADERLYESSRTPSYMLDGESLSGDPAAPGDRAQALYQALLRTQDQRLGNGEDWR